MNLALLKYPPCFEINETEWNSFLRTYTLECNEKLIEVMGLFVKSLHGTGTFYAPGNLKNRPHGDLNMQLEEIISKI